MTRCTADGRLDPNGRFQLHTDGTIRPRVMRDGERIGFEMAFMDSEPVDVADAYSDMVKDLTGSPPVATPQPASRFVPDKAALVRATAAAATAYADMCADLTRTSARHARP